ncbi:MAG TPA: FmdE family protein [Acidimicrobiales bacterium]|nr:FmdE family protein [Acidimicrobiales bacterium]
MTLTITPEEVTVDQVVAFHGHQCPGLAIGIQAGRVAWREIGPPAVDEEMVAVVETDLCAVDAIQRMTGCTFAKGNLVFRDWGKVVFTFFGRNCGRAVRVALRPDAFAADPLFVEHQALMAKAHAGEATPEEEARFRELHEIRSRTVLEMAPEVLFRVEEVDEPFPERARLHLSMACADCGESVMETRVRRLGGRDLCIPCFDRAAAR